MTMKRTHLARLPARYSTVTVVETADNLFDVLFRIPFLLATEIKNPLKNPHRIPPHQPAAPAIRLGCASRYQSKICSPVHVKTPSCLRICL